MTRLLIPLFIMLSLQVNAGNQFGPMTYQGINLTGAEFKAKRLPGVHFKDYMWPTLKNFEQMKALGFNAVRVPFLWERIQPVPLGELSVTELQQLDRVVQQTAKLNMYIVLDVHNYGNYNGRYLTNTAEDLAAFSDLWHKLSLRYKDNPYVIFGLMNEPNRQAVNVWLDLAQAAVNAIRANEAKQLILVPGTIWTGMHSWFSERIAGSNANVMSRIKDPIDNYAFEVHQYYDKDYSGMHEECVDKERFIRQFDRMSQWLRANQKKAFLGEFGVTLSPECLNALEVTMQVMDSNKDVWIGWTYWAYSDWMQNYMFNILTDDPQDARLELIKKALANPK